MNSFQLHEHALIGNFSLIQQVFLGLANIQTNQLNGLTTPINGHGGQACPFTRLFAAESAARRRPTNHGY
jgi:hypothetical protein